MLDPAERRQRLREVVSVIVVNKMRSEGDSDSATIHFRGLLRSSETVKRRVREEISTAARLGQQNGLQPDPDLEADVNNLAGSPYGTIIATFSQVMSAWSLHSPSS